MGVFNPIPSMLGGWPEGTATRNIPTQFILEDPVFKVSQRSYFIQLADFCAYALLRKERPVATKTKCGLDVAFDSHPDTRDDQPSDADLRSWLAALDWNGERRRSGAFSVGLIYSASPYLGDSWAMPRLSAWVVRRADYWGRPRNLRAGTHHGAALMPRLRPRRTE
jgi:Protein of unknown function (DUF3800)